MKKEILLAVAGMIWTTLISAQQIPDGGDDEQGVIVVIGSDFADYDGQEVSLTGEVTLEHELGTILAHKARIIKNPSVKKKKFSFLRLEGDIRLFLWEGGSFYCTCADLDYHKLQGNFYGDALQEYVTYTDNLDNGKGEFVPIVLKGKNMTVKVERPWKERRNVKPHAIDEITADHNVTVDYDREFVAAGDHMIYQRHHCGNDEDENIAISGMIYLFPDNDGRGVCQVTSRQGDVIKAQKIEIDLPLQSILFRKPKGAIYVTHCEQELQRVDFSSETLTWDQQYSLLMLKGNVTIYQKNLGKLTSTEQVQVCHDVIEGSRELKWISSTGTTELTYEDEETGDHHFLVCYGSVFVDPNHQTTVLKSPMIGDCVSSDKQVFFSDRKRQIYADNVTLDYTMEGTKGITPAKLTLEGHVKIMNDSFFDSKFQGNSLQYALADIVEYVPETQQMRLYARGEHRVLFYDCLNGVQISAPAVDVRRDSSTGKKAVEGIGDVRLTFAENEIRTLTESFDLLRSYW